MLSSRKSSTHSYSSRSDDDNLSAVSDTQSKLDKLVERMANILYQTQEELIDSPPISREELLTKNPELKLFLDDKKETPNTLEGIEETLVELANQEGFDEHLFIHSFILIEKFIVDSQIGGKIHFPRLITCVFFITQKFCFEDEIFYLVPMSEIG